jgi:YfiH family protein
VIESSPLLKQIPGLTHGFSTREGGHSTGRFASLNLGFNTEDDPTNLRKNLELFQAKFNLPEVFEVQQVHGHRVLIAKNVETRSEEADAIICQTSDLAIGIRTADCAPVLIAHRNLEGHADMVSAVHVGWRGAATNILSHTLETMHRQGASLDGLFFAIGACIGPRYFEVGMEVIHEAEKSLRSHPIPFERGSSGKAFLDLKELLVRQLLELGIKDAAIDRVGACTYEDSERYYSYRRDKGQTGRQLSFIMLTRTGQ